VVLTDSSGIRLGDVSAAGDLSVIAAGSITDADGEAVTVGGTTTLTAASGGGQFDIALDNADAHDFTGGVGASGRNIALDDRNGIRLGAVAASGDLSVSAGGSVTDSDGETIVVNGRTVITAVDAGGTDFFDIAFDNPGGHDFNIVDLTAEGIVLVDTADLTIASARGMSDGRIDPTVPGQGGIDLAVLQGDFRFEPVAAGGPVPLHAGGDISLRAPDGSFSVGAERRRLQDGLTFRSDAGDILLDFANGFVVEDLVGTGPFTLDARAGTSRLRIGNSAGTEFVGIGTQTFLTQARQPGFNPLVTTTGIGDAALFEVTGDLALEAVHPLTLRIQNTSLVSNEGAGTRVAGRTFLSGEFEGLTMFGSFAGANRTTAAIQGFADADGSFVVENSNTVNGCIILVASSCQPIGSLSLVLDFPDGLLLGVKFLDPAEDMDDPFTNRGDEEEWE
jgi:hypothetical protein